MNVPITCPCPPKAGEVRHPDGDTVTLRDKLGFHEALTIRKAIALARDDIDETDERGGAAEILATMSEFYVLKGVSSWTLEDADGKPVPVSNVTIRSVLMESLDIGLVVDAADALYQQAILLPLLNRALPSSPPTPTPSTEPEPSTSPVESSTKPPKPSKPSSTSTTPTAGIETITSLPVGGSRSSQNAQSAA